MAAIIKKRAMAQFSQTQTVEEINFLPEKRLKLTKKPCFENTALALISCLESSKTSSEVLSTLLRVSESLDITSNDVPQAIRMLSKQFKGEKKSWVRVKIMSLMGDVGLESSPDALFIIEEVLVLLKEEQSYKVIAQAIQTFLCLSCFVKDNQQIVNKLLEVAKQHLTNVTSAVRCSCLELIGVLTPPNLNKNTNETLRLVGSYFNNQDPRVRAKAFKTIIKLSERGIKLNPDIYSSVCETLTDDFEIVRTVGLKLMCILGNAYPHNVVVLPNSEQEICLIDDAFGKICNGVNDLSMNVRRLAAKLLGSMTLVSSKFLNQTLDKKLMSNMRRKRTAHELAWENMTSGEWASGKKWADDTPREVIKADNINLMSSGACGAFVHGLEDEFLEVRSATVESLCQLSVNNSQFANLALDFLVDMFNDEIEDVRIKAIDSLRCISQYISLRDDQLETILGALEDFSQDVREGLHRMLATCTLSTTVGLKMCVEKLLDNLKKYPQDRRSTFRCLQKIGAQHPELVLPLVPQLLNIHPYFDMAENDIDNPHYICILILILNAAKHLTTIVPLLEPQTLKHYLNLRDTMPTLVPELNLSSESSLVINKPSLLPESIEFLKNMVTSLNLSNNSQRVQTILLKNTKQHLQTLRGKDSTVSGAVQFTSMYIGAQLVMSEIIEKGTWLQSSALPRYPFNTLLSNIEDLLNTCLKLQYTFVGLNNEDYCSVIQLRLRALAFRLVYIVRGSNSSALAPCNHFLTALEDIKKTLVVLNVTPNYFTSSVFQELGVIEDPKPGTVSSKLIPILFKSKLSQIPQPNIKIQKTEVQIIEPSGLSDSTLKFTAGLVMAIRVEAEVLNLTDPSCLRLKVKYPDQKTKIILPKPTDLKPLNFNNGLETNLDSTNNDFRLITTVLICHQVWSEALMVDINIALEVTEAVVGKNKLSTDMSLLDLCKPIKVSVSPKPIKRTL